VFLFLDTATGQLTLARLAPDGHGGVAFKEMRTADAVPLIRRLRP
jgi:hypothetical protein